MATPHDRQRPGLLLSQLGDLASSMFSDGAARLGVTPAEAGVIRLIGRAHGLSQRQLADRLGAPPSRLVAILDKLEAQGAVVRARSQTDRRHHELALTDAGRELLHALTDVVVEQETTLLSPLPDAEAEAFVATLARLAAAHGVDPGVHRGYRSSTRSTPGP